MRLTQPDAVDRFGPSGVDPAEAAGARRNGSLATGAESNSERRERADVVSGVRGAEQEEEKEQLN